MTDKNDSQESLRKERRIYAAPKILSREPLEVIAGVCAPFPPAKGNPGFCPEGPINS